MITCRVIQFLEPDPTADIPLLSADDHSLPVEEGGALALAIGQTAYSVVFATAKLSADYDFIEQDVTNTVDGSPISLSWEFSNRTINGYTVTFDAQPDTVNYVWRYKVRVAAV